MTLAVEPDHLAIVQAILARHLPNQTRVWVYGSRARGERIWRGSDLDLLIDAGAPLPHTAMAAMAEEFSESFIPYMVDLHDWHRTDRSFLDRIEPDMQMLPLESARAG